MNTLHSTFLLNIFLKAGSVQFNHLVVSDSLWPHGLQHARLPCPSPTPGVYSNSCPLSRWCHPTILSSVIAFSSCLESLLASGSFQMSQLFTSCGQSIGVSASTSVLPMNIQDWFPLGWTGWISLQSRGLSRVFCNTTVQKHQFFGAQRTPVILFTQSLNTHILLGLTWNCPQWYFSFRDPLVCVLLLILLDDVVTVSGTSCLNEDLSSSAFVPPPPSLWSFVAF